MATPAKKEYTVLIVDDNAMLLELVSESLAQIGGFTVVTAEDGVQGLERFYEVRPDCAIIDVRMPGLNGYQLVRALRGDPETATIPLVILTAMAQEKDQFAGMAAGADQYLLKPTEPADLVTAIQRALALSEAERLQRMQHLAEDPPAEQ